jgi:hypothetical protein
LTVPWTTAPPVVIDVAPPVETDGVPAASAPTALSATVAATASATLSLRFIPSLLASDGFRALYLVPDGKVRGMADAQIMLQAGDAGRVVV